MDVTNAMRAEWAFHGLRTYARVTRPSFEGIDTVDELVADPDLANEWIGDLLGDLFHLADRSGLDPMAVLDRAISYYREEVEEEAIFGEGADY
ncbi:MAG TPA: hypothetical protein VF377_08985 [Acidimicrobiia bacterium]